MDGRWIARRYRKSLLQHELLHGHKRGGRGDSQMIRARGNSRSRMGSRRFYSSYDALKEGSAERKLWLAREERGIRIGLQKRKRTVAAITGEPLAPGQVGVDIKNLSCSQYQLYFAMENSRKHCCWMPSFQTSKTRETIPLEPKNGCQRFPLVDYQFIWSC